MFFSKPKNFQQIVQEIYQNIVERSRSKFFYLNLDIQDDIESRFDLIIIHAFMIFYYFKKLDDNRNQYAQSLFDTMFNDFDNNLREMGFGDIAVNKKMKVFITAFYGRISQYSIGMDNILNINNFEVFNKAIKNNIYKGRDTNLIQEKFFKNYIVDNIRDFNRNSIEKNLKNKFSFINLPLESVDLK